jgi:hypothetical protein
MYICTHKNITHTQTVYNFVFAKTWKKTSFGKIWFDFFSKKRKLVERNHPGFNQGCKQMSCNLFKHDFRINGDCDQGTCSVSAQPLFILTWSIKANIFGNILETILWSNEIFTEIN